MFYFVLFQKHAKGATLLEKACRHLDLQESDYFGLTYKDASEARVSTKRNLLTWLLYMLTCNLQPHQRMFQVLSIMHCPNGWYLNFNRCSSEQQSLKTVGKTEFWNWNLFVTLRGEFTFDLMGRSFTVIGTCLSS